MLSPTVSLVVCTNVRPSIRDAFIASYAHFAPRCRTVDTPSVTLVAIDDTRGRVDGILTIPAVAGAIATAVVGRHDRANLRLEAHENLALRHLALIVEPATSWARGSADVTYRLLDLRTGTGFSGEQDQPLVAVRCAGTAFFRCAGYTLLALATGDPTDWPEDPWEAWSMIPERVLLDERASRVVLRSVPSVERCDGRTTLVTSLHRVRAAIECDDPVAMIAVGDGHRFGVDRAALADGVLIGRYPRCDAADHFADPSISRAHLLILSLDGRPHAIDLASSCGTRAGGATIHAMALGDQAQLEIAATSLRWTQL